MLISETAFNAIAAATFTALLTLIGLILTKEQKISEFRQEWINSLRTEMTTYITYINQIRDLDSVTYESEQDRTKVLAESYLKLNLASFAMSLRLNPDEKRVQSVFASMKEFQDIIKSGTTIHPDVIRSIESRFLKAAKGLLKYEWKIVKRGEATFIITKFAALVYLIVGISIGVVYFNSNDLISKTKPPEVIESQKVN